MSNIFLPGNTTVYIRQSGANIQYSEDQFSWSNLTFPVTVFNYDTLLGILKIEFTTNITILNNNQYFECGSSHIQFGSTSLKNDGTRPIITINVNNYDGLIQNGQQGLAGNNHIYVYNLIITGDGQTTQIGAGWLGKKGFSNAATNNYIVNCSSIGELPGGAVGSGGIVGAFAAKDGGILYINGCSSSCTMGQLDGGIVVAYAGQNGGSVICKECYTTGVIGSFAGGIFGDYAGDSGYAEANKCYTTGAIGSNAGGIFGRFAGNSGEAIANKCYSRGIIGVDGGGIYGIGSGSDTGTTLATNCYSSGIINTSGNGIYGTGKVNGTETNCYAADDDWTNSAANAALIGTPNPVVGTTWISRGFNIRYELNDMGYTPYQTLIIDASSNLIKIYEQSVQQGLNSNSAVIYDASGSAFEILQISGGDVSSYNTITMNSTSGVISTTFLRTLRTKPGVYTILLRNVGSYHVTQFQLTITLSPAFYINVRTLNNKLIYLYCENNYTIEQIKTQIYNQIGMRQDTQALFYKARAMFNTVMISFYGVKDNDTLHIGLIQPKQRLIF